MTILKAARSKKRTGPSLRKAVYTAERRGILYASKWPRHKGRSPSPQVRHNQEWFAKAQAAYKLTAPQIIVTAMQATAGTPLLARDLLTSAMAGRLFSITVQGERTLYPVAARIDVSTSIDILGHNPGDMLYRGPEIWATFPAGRPGQHLMSNGPLSSPTWESVPPTKDLTMLSSSPLENEVGEAFALQGNFFGAGFNITVTHVYSVITLVDTAIYVPIIARMDGEDIAEILYRGSEFVATAAGKDIVTWPLPAPVTLLKGQSYIAAVYRRDATTTTDLKIWVGISQLRGWPWKGLITIVRGATINPQVGDTLDLDGEPDIRSCHLVYQI